MNMEFAMRMLKSKLRFRKNWAILKLQCLWMKILLWLMETEIDVLIAMKRLIQRFGGSDNG